MLIAIILANLAVFVAMAVVTGHIGWSARELLRWGGDLGQLSLHGQPWRLLTGTYLHAGLGHILGNMLLLFYAGRFVEGRIGPARFLLAYTVSGLAASLLSATVHPNVVGVGASGAIAGIVGIIVVLWLSGRCPEISGGWVVQTVGINALYSLAPNVDWLAHTGGFVAGLAAGGALLATSAVPRSAP